MQRPLKRKLRLEKSQKWSCFSTILHTFFEACVQHRLIKLNSKRFPNGLLQKNGAVSAVSRTAYNSHIFSVNRRVRCSYILMGNSAGACWKGQQDFSHYGR